MSQLQLPICKDPCGCKLPEYTFFWKADCWDWGWYENPRVASTQMKHRLRLKGCKDEWHPRPDDQKDADYFTFGFVRNPYNRIASCFRQPHHDVYSGLTYRWQRIWNKGPDFNRFIDEIFEDYSNLKCNQDHHWYFQHWYVPPDKVSFVGKFESFEEDYQTVQDTIGSSYARGHEWERVNDAPALRQLSDSSISKIQKMYEADFDLFHYSKDISKLL